MSALPQLTDTFMPPLTIVREIDGASFLYADAPRPPRCGVHWHDKVITSFLLSGTVLEVDERGKKVECGPLTLHTTPPGMRHAHVITTPRVTTLCIGIEQSLMAKLGQAARILEEPITSRRAGILCLAPKIRRELVVGDSASDLVLQGLIFELVGELARRGDGKIAVDAPAWLRRAKEMLNDKWNQSVSIEEIAATVGVHPSQLNRAFRAHMKQTPGEYLRRIRMERATRQVLASDLPLKVIAAQAGFADQAHFTREFRRRHGVPPMEMRRMMHGA